MYAEKVNRIENALSNDLSIMCNADELHTALDDFAAHHIDKAPQDLPSMVKLALAECNEASEDVISEEVGKIIDTISEKLSADTAIASIMTYFMPRIPDRYQSSNNPYEKMLANKILEHLDEALEIDPYTNSIRVSHLKNDLGTAFIAQANYKALQKIDKIMAFDSDILEDNSFVPSQHLLEALKPEARDAVDFDDAIERTLPYLQDEADSDITSAGYTLIAMGMYISPAREDLTIKLKEEVRWLVDVMNNRHGVDFVDGFESTMKEMADELDQLSPQGFSANRELLNVVQETSAQIRLDNPDTSVNTHDM